MNPIRLLFWNTYLLQPRPIPGGPGLPAIGELAAPAVAERAARIGATLGGRFDIVALAEAFEDVDRRRITTSWGGGPLSTAEGPRRSLRHGPLGFTSSGLFTLVDRCEITRRAVHRFVTRGSYLHDADALANKGVLMVEVDLGADAGRLEVYSTHLLYGTGLLGGRVAREPLRRHRLRMAQVDEMVGFVQREHRRGSTAMIVGDMNVPAVDPDYPDGIDAQYRDLLAHLSPLGASDLWRAHGQGDGPTCGAPSDRFADQVDPDDPDALVDRPDHEDAPERIDVARRERIDYLFLAEPNDEVSPMQVTSMKRYAFPRDPDAPGYQRLARLSDHLAIGAELEQR